jgi:pimeloyl-ACP methyl ester carboxylesterase
VIIAGHSQGGGAALWAAQLARSYAPELDVRGVVALAPAAQLTTILRVAGSSPFNTYLGDLLLAADGLHAGYGASFDPSTFLTRAALADLATVSKECVDTTIARWRGRSQNALLARDPTTIPGIENILEQNSPGATAPGVPIFIGQGSLDREIPLQVSAQLEARYCRLGATVIRRVYPGADHDGVVDAARSDVLAWIADRYAGSPITNDC